MNLARRRGRIITETVFHRRRWFDLDNPTTWLTTVQTENRLNRFLPSVSKKQDAALKTNRLTKAMPRNGNSFYINSLGANKESIELGLQWLVSQCKSTSTAGLLAVSQKQNLKNIASWRQYGGIFEALHKSHKCNTNGTSILLHTEKIKVSSHNGPALVIYGGQRLLDSVDSIHGHIDILFIPWNDSDHLNWVSTWNAKELGKHSQDHGQKKELLDDISVIALEQLTMRINMNNGISGPSDYPIALETFETLFHKQAKCDPESIRQQLIRLGWPPEVAKDAKALAEKVWGGRRPKGSAGKADESMWDHWQKQLDQPGC